MLQDDRAAGPNCARAWPLVPADRASRLARPGSSNDPVQSSLPPPRGGVFDRLQRFEWPRTTQFEWPRTTQFDRHSLRGGGGLRLTWALPLPLLHCFGRTAVPVSRWPCHRPHRIVPARSANHRWRLAKKNRLAYRRSLQRLIWNDVLASSQPCLVSLSLIHI